jgi:hypothetical protein
VIRDFVTLLKDRKRREIVLFSGRDRSGWSLSKGREKEESAYKEEFHDF